MINPIKFIKNWIKLTCVIRTINKYKIYGETKIKIKRISICKYPILNILRIKLNGVTCAILISTRHKSNINTYINFIWLNRKYSSDISLEAESAYYQTLYEVFMRWYDCFSFRKIGSPQRIAISIDITNTAMVERFRRILTLYGFQPDPKLTIEDTEFKTPWRGKEKITQVIYSKVT